MSQLLPSVTLVNRENYILFAAFLQDCTEYSLSSTFTYVTTPLNFTSDQFFHWLQADSVYVLSLNNKSLGYVVLREHNREEESIVDFTTFLHPRVCKMAVINLLKGASCLAAIYSVINHSNTITTFLYHKMLLASLRQSFGSLVKSHSVAFFDFCQIDMTSFNYDLDLLIQALCNVYDEDTVTPYLELF